MKVRAGVVLISLVVAACSSGGETAGVSPNAELGEPAPLSEDGVRVISSQWQASAEFTEVMSVSDDLLIARDIFSSYSGSGRSETRSVDRCSIEAWTLPEGRPVELPFVELGLQDPPNPNVAGVPREVDVRVAPSPSKTLCAVTYSAPSFVFPRMDERGRRLAEEEFQRPGEAAFSEFDPPNEFVIVNVERDEIVRTVSFDPPPGATVTNRIAYTTGVESFEGVLVFWRKYETPVRVTLDDSLPSQSVANVVVDFVGVDSASGETLWEKEYQCDGCKEVLVGSARPGGNPAERADLRVAWSSPEVFVPPADSRPSRPRIRWVPKTASFNANTGNEVTAPPFFVTGDECPGKGQLEYGDTPSSGRSLSEFYVGRLLDELPDIDPDNRTGSEIELAETLPLPSVYRLSDGEASLVFENVAEPFSALGRRTFERFDFFSAGCVGVSDEVLATEDSFLNFENGEAVKLRDGQIMAVSGPFIWTETSGLVKQIDTRDLETVWETQLPAPLTGRFITTTAVPGEKRVGVSRGLALNDFVLLANTNSGTFYIVDIKD